MRPAVVAVGVALMSLLCGAAAKKDEVEGQAKAPAAQPDLKSLSSEQKKQLKAEIVQRLLQRRNTTAAADAPAEPDGGKLYPECPPHPMTGAKAGSYTLEEWVVAGLQAAPFTDVPFKRAVFWCHVFPPETFADLDAYWPPTALMHQDLKSAKNKRASHKHADERFKTSMEDFVKIPASKASKAFPEYAKAKSVWQSVSKALYSKAFEKALWEKMGISKKWTFRDFRIQTDRQGFAIGAHPDISKKIATMMFYVPYGTAEQQLQQALTYGTCLHTKAQYAARSKVDGSATCATKFKYLPNAGYSFTVSKSSFHSATAGDFGLRRTIMLNWYNAVWKN